MRARPGVPGTLINAGRRRFLSTKMRADDVRVVAAEVTRLLGKTNGTLIGTVGPALAPRLFHQQAGRKRQPYPPDPKPNGSRRRAVSLEDATSPSHPSLVT